jgi:hypothetical protein
MWDPTAEQELAHGAGLRREPRTDDADRAGGAAQQTVAAGDEGGEDLVAQARLGGDDPPQRCRRHDEHLAGDGDAGGHEHALAGQQVQLAQEPSRAVACEVLLVAAGADDDVDFARQHDMEVIGGVALSVEVLAGRDQTSGAERVEGGEVRIGQLGSLGDVVSHGRAR